MRSTGRVAELGQKSANTTGELGIAHTRWATHGVPSERNAHPHISRNLIAVVHNGIIENYEELRTNLTAQGYEFTSDTDTEVIAHLIHSHYAQGNLLVATQMALAQLVGAYAIGVVAADNPHQLIASRKGSPLLLGVGEGEHFVGSDMSALLQVTKNVVYLEEGDVVEVNLANYRIFDAQGNAVQRQVHVSELNNDSVELGEYKHYMQKEIHEQPQALAEHAGIGVQQPIAGARHLRRGSEHHLPAGRKHPHPRLRHQQPCRAGRALLAGRDRRHPVQRGSGQRIPLPHQRRQSQRRWWSPSRNRAKPPIRWPRSTTPKLTGHMFTLAICNVPESAIVRQSKLRFLTRAGPEIGVASTKAFTTQLAALFLLTLVLAKLRGRLSAEREQQFLHELRHLPSAVQKVLALEPKIAELSKHFADKHHALFLGRGMHYPIALEGALKLKEISYIHAEAYPAGELKHGPLALVDKDMPVVSVAPNDALLEKLKSNLQEVRARGGELYVFADANTHMKNGEGIHILQMPEHAGFLSPILHTIPLQLLAYYVALQKGTDVDKPRNLAKSVTVE